MGSNQTPTPESEALAALLAIRGALPRAGLDVMDGPARCFLQGAAHVGLVFRPLHLHYIETSEPGTSRRLLALDACTGDPLLTFLGLRLVFQRFVYAGTDPHRRRVARQAADIGTLACLYPADEGGPQFLDRAGNELYAVRPHAWTDQLPDLLDASRRILRAAGSFGSSWTVEREATEAMVAVIAGRRLRALSRLEAAQRWFELGLLIGSETGDWDAVSAAHGGIGKVFKARGAYPDARRGFLRSLAVAQRRNLRPLASAYALHDLASLEIERSNASEAARLARAALMAYRASSSSCTRLVHDVAFLFIREGRFRPATTALSAAVRDARDPDAVVLVRSALARAVAGTGDRRRYASEWDAAWGVARANQDSIEAPSAYLNLAHAARMMGETGRAMRAAEMAHSLAMVIGETKTLLESETVLDSLQHAGVSPAAPAEAEADENVEAFSSAVELVLAAA